ncbi:MAG: protein translocase subunit SecDF, partial [Bacteroidales bacterium]|nr:protein translocase subunit SecDF [Bacteroidales bacterium]
MQNKGAIRLLAILFALVTIYQLSFSYFTQRTQKKAREYASDVRFENQAKALASKYGRAETYYLDSLKNAAESYYLDSMSNEVIYNLGIIDFTYSDCKERELNLGLDLKGGMNVTLEVQVQDVVNAMAGSNRNLPEFQKAVADAIEEQKNSQSDFITIFYEVFKRENPTALLRTYFRTQELKDQIKPDASDEDVLKVLHAQAEAAIGNTYDVLSKRIDQFGVAQPRIQRLQTAGRILVELPGVKDPKRVRKILQSTARLEFWETYSFNEEVVYSNLSRADQITYNYYKSLQAPQESAAENEDTLSLSSGEEAPALLSETSSDTLNESDTASAENSLLAAASDTSNTQTASTDSLEDDNSTPRLFRYLSPNFYKDGSSWRPGYGAVVGLSAVRDTARVNAMLALPQVKSLFPRDLRFMWKAKTSKDAVGVVELYSIKVSRRDGQAPLDGEA